MHDLKHRLDREAVRVHATLDARERIVNRAEHRAVRRRLRAGVFGSALAILLVAAMLSVLRANDKVGNLSPHSTPTWSSSTAFESTEAPWVFTYPSSWAVATHASADPAFMANRMSTFVSNVELPTNWTAGPNSEPLPSTVSDTTAIVLIERLWNTGAAAAMRTNHNGWGPGPFADDAQNPGWTFNERARCEGTLCFHVLEWFGPAASDEDRAAAERVAASVRLGDQRRWTETDGVQTTLHDEDNLFIVTYPNEGWQAAEENLTPWLGSPSEILSLGTLAMPVSHDPDDELRVFDAPVAPATLAALGPLDMFVSIQEGGPSERDDRPSSFRHAAEPGCCSEQAGDYPFTWWWVPFSDAGRSLYLFVAIGADVPSERANEAWAVADSLWFAPR